MQKKEQIRLKEEYEMKSEQRMTGKRDLKSWDQLKQRSWSYKKEEQRMEPPRGQSGWKNRSEKKITDDFQAGIGQICRKKD